MRNAIADVYGGPRWRTRCLYEMSEQQVIAIYKDMEKTGRLKMKEKKRRNRLKLPDHEEPNCIQLSIWDILKNERNDK